MKLRRVTLVVAGVLTLWWLGRFAFEGWTSTTKTVAAIIMIMMGTLLIIPLKVTLQQRPSLLRRRRRVAITPPEPFNLDMIEGE